IMDTMIRYIRTGIDVLYPNGIGEDELLEWNTNVTTAFSTAGGMLAADPSKFFSIHDPRFSLFFVHLLFLFTFISYVLIIADGPTKQQIEALITLFEPSAMENPENILDLPLSLFLDFLKPTNQLLC